MKAKKNPQEEDEFFGNDDDSDGLAVAQDTALQEEFTNLGFHESFDNARNLSLSTGFREGYTQVYEQTVEIGRLLGRVALSESKHTASITTTKVANTIRQAMQNANVAGTIDAEPHCLEPERLKDLEERIKAVISQQPVN